MRITEELSHKGDGNPGGEEDFGLLVVLSEEERREEELDYCRDFFLDFVELAESYAPHIVREFVERFPWQHRKWKKEGVVIPMGGAYSKASL